MVKGARKDIWSATRIDVANYCRMRYYLIYVEGEHRLNLSAYEKGSLLHHVIENFWADDNGNKIPRYSSPEEFAKKTQGKWMQRIIVSEKTGRQIHWRFDEEKYFVKSQLKDICIPLYPYLLNEGPPLYTELPFLFSFSQGGRRKLFRGRIDELRIRDGKAILRDYKSGNPWIGQQKVDHDPQMTTYNAGLCAICQTNPQFAKSLNLENSLVSSSNNPNFILESLNSEFFMTDSFLHKDKKEPPPTLQKTFRKEEHFYELIRMIDGTLESITNNTIYPERGRKCDSCDVNEACAKRLSCAKNSLNCDKNGQLYFEFAAPLYIRPLAPIKKMKAQSNQRLFSFMKKKKSNPS